MKTKQKTRNIIRKYPIAVGLISVLLSFIILKLLPDSNVAVQIIKRALLSAALLYTMYLAGGKEALCWEKGSFGKSVRLYKSMLIILFIIAFIINFPMHFMSEQPVKNWYWNLLILIPNAFFIGLFEESAFRGLLLEGLLARIGKSRGGLFAALTFSSLLFGFLHVVLDLGGEQSAATMVQIISKTVQTGMMGFLIGAVYLKTKNIWAAGILHGLGDYFLMSLMAVFGGELDGYVQTDETLMSAVIVAVYSIVIHIIPLIAGIRIAKNLPLPQLGLWKKWSENDSIETSMKY